MYKSGYYMIKHKDSLVPKYVVNINDDLYIFKSAAGKCGQWEQIMEWDIKSECLN